MASIEDQLKDVASKIDAKEVEIKKFKEDNEGKCNITNFTN